MQVNAGNVLILNEEKWLTLKLYIICVEFKNYVIKLFRKCNCNVGLMAAAFM
jgi:hypothetical protein